MQATDAKGGPAPRPPWTRRADQTLTVTVQFRLDACGESDRRLDALLSLLGEDQPTILPPPAHEADADLRIHAEARAVYRGGTEIALTRLEYDLLLCLAEHPRRVFTRRQLLERVWGHSYTSPRSVDVHVRRLRAKIGADVPVVATLRGVGYRLAADCAVEVVPDPGLSRRPVDGGKALAAWRSADPGGG